MYKNILLFALSIMLFSCSTINHKNVAVEKAKIYLQKNIPNANEERLEIIRNSKTSIQQAPISLKNNSLDVPSADLMQSCIVFKSKKLSKNIIVFGVGKPTLENWEPIKIIYK